jgi:hypothetical protein
MRKSFSSLAIIGALSLGGCATSPYGGMGGPLEAVLGSVLGAGQSGGGDFQRAAVNACGNYASQYGQVSVRDVRQQSRDTLRVYGLIGTNFGTRDFECSFRSDGRITDFDV